MFTGIITNIGRVQTSGAGSFAIASGYPAPSIEIGASIACDGVCLTVTSVVAKGDGSLFTVDVSNETRSKTTLGDWKEGRLVNLERPLKPVDELGGHVVSGHVDGVARIVDIRPDGESRRFSFEVAEHLAAFIAPKGSVALDGTSLTVNEVAGERFGVNLIPHTLTQTTWAGKKTGDLVNLEVDVFARYVARLMEFRP
jgi:riboflavin synthase